MTYKSDSCPFRPTTIRVAASVILSAMLWTAGCAASDAELSRRQPDPEPPASAEKALFEPLGIDRTEWFKNDEGHPHLGGGLDLRPRDMAKFGLLYLRGGRWNGRQVVPEAWVRESTRRQVVFDHPRGRAVGYGYWWWILPPDPRGAGKQDIWGAFGFRAQYIFCIPEHDMVVVVTGGARGWEEERNPRDFLYTRILPAVERD